MTGTLPGTVVSPSHSYLWYRSVCSLHEASRALVADVGVGVGVGAGFEDDENGQAGAAQR